MEVASHMPSFLKITAVVALALIALVVLSFVLKILIVAAIVAALIVGALWIVRAVRRRSSRAVTLVARQ